MSSLTWSQLPILALQRVLYHLDVKDAVAATSTCNHWRNAIYLYDGHREVLKLTVGPDMEKNLFLTRMFKKHVKRLRLRLDWEGYDMADFLELVLIQFYDSKWLCDINFIGAGYKETKQHMSIVHLKSPIIHNLIIRHRLNLETLGLLGCKVTQLTEGKEIEPKGFAFIPSMIRESEEFDRCTLQMYTTLQHLCFDYDTLTQETLNGLTMLPRLYYLSLNFVSRMSCQFKSFNWDMPNKYFSTKFMVVINLIDICSKMMDALVDRVLVEDMPLGAIRVLFCKTLSIRLIQHLSQYYKNTLQELQWIDAHREDHYAAVGPVRFSTRSDVSEVNPFILISWQCIYLARLVIHGYWIWQYDLMGISRLRHSTLRHLEVSSPFKRRFHVNSHTADAILAVVVGDSEPTTDENFIEQMNEYLQFPFKDDKWSNLPVALGPESTLTSRVNYIHDLILRPPDLEEII